VRGGVRISIIGDKRRASGGSLRDSRDWVNTICRKSQALTRRDNVMDEKNGKISQGPRPHASLQSGLQVGFTVVQCIDDS
jgi:hypothetical protein